MNIRVVMKLNQEYKPLQMKRELYTIESKTYM